MEKKKRKPRLNTNTSSIMPYRYVLIKVKSVKQISKPNEFNCCDYDVAYTFDKESYYYEKYGNEVFHKTVSMPFDMKYYKVGKVYLEPMTIDID